jgi:hypothetical protein
MKFFNRNVLLYALMVAIATTLLYLVCFRYVALNNAVVSLMVLGYVAAIVVSCIYFSRNDEYGGYFGFNYHFVTYVICNGLALLFSKMQLVQAHGLVSMAISWGLGLAVHFIIWAVVFRKRKLKGYDKSEIF